MGDFGKTDSQHHRLDFERDDDGEIDVSSVQFTCTAPPEAPCRNYPECECESRYDGHGERHPAVPQDSCWMVPWWENEEPLWWDMDQLATPGPIVGVWDVDWRVEYLGWKRAVSDGIEVS